METPEIVPEIGGYCLTWPVLSLRVKVGRLDVHSSDGRVTGEITISNSHLENPTILLPSTSFNFSSEPTRSKYASSLKKKYPDAEHDWVELFDYLGHKVQELARQGEEVEEIWAGEEVDPPKLLLNPVIYEGVSNIIYGEKGVNKTTIVYMMAAIMALPWRDNPLQFEVPSRPVRSLFLDWEMNAFLSRYYIDRLRIGSGFPATCPIYYRHCTLPLAEEIEQIQKQIEKNNIDVLIIDSLAAASGGGSEELKGSSAALQFNAALRKLNRTSLIVAQTSKTQEGKKTIYGSVMFTYYARNIFELCRSEENDGNTIHLGLFHRESNLGPRHPPIGLSVTYNEYQSISVQREPLSISEFTTKVSMEVRLLALLKREPLSAKDIADSLEIKAPYTNMLLSRTRAKGKITKVGEKWGLVSHQ